MCTALWVYFVVWYRRLLFYCPIFVNACVAVADILHWSKRKSLSWKHALMYKKMDCSNWFLSISACRVLLIMFVSVSFQQVRLYCQCYCSPWVILCSSHVALLKLNFTMVSDIFVMWYRMKKRNMMVWSMMINMYQIYLYRFSRDKLVLVQPTIPFPHVVEVLLLD